MPDILSQARKMKLYSLKLIDGKYYVVHSVIHCAVGKARVDE